MQSLHVMLALHTLTDTRTHTHTHKAVSYVMNTLCMQALLTRGRVTVA